MRQDGKTNALFGHTTFFSNLVARHNMYSHKILNILCVSLSDNKITLIKFDVLFISMDDIDSSKRTFWRSMLFDTYIFY